MGIYPIGVDEVSAFTRTEEIRLAISASDSGDETLELLRLLAKKSGSRFFLHNLLYTTNVQHHLGLSPIAH